MSEKDTIIEKIEGLAFFIPQNLPDELTRAVNKFTILNNPIF